MLIRVEVGAVSVEVEAIRAGVFMRVGSREWWLPLRRLPVASPRPGLAVIAGGRDDRAA